MGVTYYGVAYKLLWIHVSSTGGEVCEYDVSYGALSATIKAKSSKNLQQLIIQRFHIDSEQSLFLQYFDESWNAWQTCGWDEIPPGAKLNVTSGLYYQDSYQDNPSADDSGNLFLTPSTDANLTRQIQDSIMEHCLSGSNVPQHSQQNWPDVYRIPIDKIENDILMVLDRGYCPQERRLTRFLDAIYEDATRYTFYPSGVHYEEMANAILNKWPHLVTEKAGMTMAEAKTLWRKRILHKFQNSRRRRDSNNAVVQRHKHKYGRVLEF